MVLPLFACDRETDKPQDIPDGGPGDGTTYGIKKDMIFFCGAEKTVICYETGGQTEISEPVSDYQISLDGDKSAFMASFSEEYGCGNLYYVSASGSGEPVKVAERVYSYTLSDSGDSVIYFTQRTVRNSQEGTGTLNLFDGTESKVIDENVFFLTNGGAVAVSPNGKTVFYIKDVEIDIAAQTVKNMAYVNIGGKNHVLGETNIMPFLIADNAKYLYYTRIETDGTTSIMMQAGIDSKTGVKIVSSAEDFWGMALNRSYSQTVFNAGTTAYICIDGTGRQEIPGLTFEQFIIPENGQTKQKQGMPYVVYGFRSFAGKPFMSNIECFRLRADLSGETLSPYSADAKMSRDESRIYYTEEKTDEEVYIKTLNAVEISDSAEIKTVLELRGKDEFGREKNLGSYAEAPDGTVYYVNQKKELYRKSPSEPPESEGEKLAETVRKATLCVSASGTAYFLNSDKNLYCVNGGGVRKIGENFAYTGVHNNNVFCYAETEIYESFDVFKIEDDEKLVPVISGVKITDARYNEYEPPI
jgi:hypothetical protein